ncbi:hypothetical protein [Alistipes senegalensis]|uniref:hypothetical protein n=1 Tax=Alistipes senegalensis TaxID=1288121 RepID=UPI0018A9ED3D|nr:hypothetical protein [Alistipes senegalensis]
MKKILLTFCLALSATRTDASVFPALDKTFGAARVSTSGNVLTVTTGPVTQQWRLMPGGLETVGLTNNLSGKKWYTSGNGMPDWCIYGLTEGQPARLVSLEADRDDDQGFTTMHLRVTALFEYPGIGTTVKYEIWAYPNAGGILTRLGAKGHGAKYFREQKPAYGDQVTFEHKSDKAKTTFSALNPLQPNWYNSVARSDKPVEITVGNLRPGKEYKIVFTFWNGTGDESIRQDIFFRNAGHNLPLVSNMEVKPYAQPQTVTTDIPAAAVKEAQGTIAVSGVAGGFAQVSEVWIYEKSERPHIRDILFASPRRRQEVTASAPDGYRLVGYDDLGTKTGILPQAPNGYVAHIPFEASGTTRHYIGYYTDTQNRNTRETPLLWEDTCSGTIDGSEKICLASAVSVEQDGEGLLLLKESHKCVNQYGVDTGDFTMDRTGIFNRGLGFSADDITPDKFVTGWANWTLLFSGRDRALPLKKFDRARFPVRPLTVMSNTWGSNNRNPRHSAREENVLREIESARDLGIDILQVDDGWQGITYQYWRPAPYAELDYTGRYPLYPEGWKNIREAARKAGVELGIWFAWNAPAKDIIWNFDQGGFIGFKLDFSVLDTKAKLDTLMGKARALVLHSGHRASLNWDLTEVAPRVGIYYGREYGNVYLENRKPNLPERIVYVPYLVLRDAWHLSRYANLNQYQISIQHVASVSRKLSNAHLYSQGYATAIALMGSPLFFCETQYMNEQERKQVRSLVGVYKKEREKMARGYVSPIGDEPDDASWTGFRNHIEGTGEGYLMLFREAANKQREKRIELEGCADKTIRLTNLLTGETTEKTADGKGAITFCMDIPADYRFYTYTIL